MKKFPSSELVPTIKSAELKKSVSEIFRGLISNVFIPATGYGE